MISGPKRKSRPGYRHRKDNGPQEYQIEPVPPPRPQDLGTLTRYTQEILSGGPRALIAAEHKAAKLAQEFGVDIESQWCLSTPYIKQLENSQPRQAAFALNWRPRYLAVLSLSRSHIFACRAAHVSNMTPLNHRKFDPAFDQQCLLAEEYAIHLLHDVTMKSAIEGECEPVFWQGIQVGYIKKVDNRVRIEMLRAHMPKTFKTPGTKVAIATGNITNNTLICDEETRAHLISLRQDALKRINAASTTPPVTADALVG